MMRFFFRMMTIGAMAAIMPVLSCHAQEANPSPRKKPLLPPNKYTLADPDRKAQKAKPIFQIYPQSLTLSERAGTPAYTGMQTLGWGWFCHAEHRFRQTTKVPLFVRLGSVEQTNRLEGK
ncbi:MAG: hypothetical protein MUE99_12205 [Chitinophagaceae bacterium]|jgi:hypothetical protein|nr:hypothetical protein [Chitinophagaceae bacterium]